MKKKATLLGFICLAVVLTALPFMAACAEPAPPAPPGAPTVITPTPTIVTPSPGLPPAPVAPTPAPTTPAGPAAPVTPAPAPVVVPAPAGEPVFTVLDPRATEAAIEYVGLVPRLDTIDGKKIVAVNLHGGNETANRSIGPALQAQYPSCIADSHEASSMWKMEKPEMQSLVDNYDGAILAQNY